MWRGSYDTRIYWVVSLMVRSSNIGGSHPSTCKCSTGSHACRRCRSGRLQWHCNLLWRRFGLSQGGYINRSVLYVRIIESTAPLEIRTKARTGSPTRPRCLNRTRTSRQGEPRSRPPHDTRPRPKSSPFTTSPGGCAPCASPELLRSTASRARTRRRTICRTS
jgi:hypothetical protein